MALKKVKRGNTWYAHGTVKGKRIRESLGTTNGKVADELLVELEAGLMRSAIFGAEHDKNQLLFGDAAEMWVASGKGGSYHHLPRIIKYFEGRKISEIKPDDGLKCARAVCSREGVTGVSINGCVIAPIKAIINYAYKIGEGPMVPILKAKVKKEEKRVTRAATRDWHFEFRKACLDAGAVEIAVLARVMVETGCRISEALQLRPEDVIGDDRLLFRKTKTDRNVEVMVSKGLVEELRHLTVKPDGRLMPYKGHQAARNVWKRICERNGLEYIPPHQAGRHTFATWLAEAGFDATEIANQGVGWKTVSIVHDVYLHPLKEKAAGAQVVARMFDGDFESGTKLTHQPPGND